MKKIFIYILISTIISIQLSCETDANIPIPSQDPKFVLTSFVNLERDSQYFTLTQSDPLFDGSNVDNEKYIDAAVVTVSNGISNVQLPYNYNYNAYLLDASAMKINYNTNYTIHVEYQGKAINSSFSTFDSAAIVINEIKIDSILKTDEFGFSTKTYYANVKWQDPASEKNYYCLEMFGLFRSDFGQIIRVPLSDYYGSVYLSDEGKNGTEMTRTMEAYTTMFGDFGQTYLGFDVVISKTDEHYYRYFKSLQNYVGDDPFSEPSLVYTNITNGLGVIGSYVPYFIRKEL